MENKSNFGISLLANSTEPNIVKHKITHEKATMLVKIEYINSEIEFDFSEMTFTSREELSKMNKLV